MTIIDAKEILDKVNSDLKSGISLLEARPVLCVISIGENKSLRSAIEKKQKLAEHIGIKFKSVNFSEDTTTKQLRKKIARLVHLKKYSDIIIQLPLPEYLNQMYITNSIPPRYDAECSTACNMGKFYFSSLSNLAPPLINAIDLVLNRYKISIKGKNVAIIGAELLKSKLLSIFFLNNGASVTIIPDPDSISHCAEKADIIIGDAKRLKFREQDAVKDGCCIINIGSAAENGRTEKNIDLNSFKNKNCLVLSDSKDMEDLAISMLFKNILSKK